MDVFPAAGMPDDGNGLPGQHGKRNILQDIAVAGVSEVDLIELHFPFYPVGDEFTFCPGNIVVVQYTENSFAGDHTHLKNVEFIGDHPQWAEEKVR